MLLLISPAKTLNFSPQSICPTATKPELYAQPKKLIALLRALSSQQIGGGYRPMGHRLRSRPANT